MYSTAHEVRSLASGSQLFLELSALLHRLRSPRTYAKGEALFRCGDETEGLYLIEDGKVSLLVCASARRPRIFASARAGTVLGLSEAISGNPHKLTAEASALTRVSFVGRDEFLRLLQQNQEFCLLIVHMLSEDVHYLYSKFREESGPNRRSPRAPAKPVN